MLPSIFNPGQHFTNFRSKNFCDDLDTSFYLYNVSLEATLRDNHLQFVEIGRNAAIYSSPDRNNILGCCASSSDVAFAWLLLVLYLHYIY